MPPTRSMTIQSRPNPLWARRSRTYGCGLALDSRWLGLLGGLRSYVRAAISWSATRRARARDKHYRLASRRTCGDLTSAFDFSKPSDSLPRLPDTSRYRSETDKACSALPNPIVPAVSTQPLQEPGTRLARPIPYRLHARARIEPSDNRLWIDFTNDGKAVPCFIASQWRTSTAPGHTQWNQVEKGFSDSWRLTRSRGRTPGGIANAEGKYSLSVFEPMGFCANLKVPPTRK